MTTYLLAEDASAILKEVEQRFARTYRQVEDGCRLLASQGAPPEELTAYTTEAGRRFQSELEAWLKVTLDAAAGRVHQ